MHLHSGILLGHRKEENLTFWDSMNWPGEYYAKWNKPVRERQIPYDFPYMWNLMNKTKKYNRNGFIDTENWQLSGGREVVGLGEKGEGIKQKKKEQQQQNPLKPDWCGSVDWVQAANQSVSGPSPSPGTGLGCGPGPQ